ncbi:MAG: hypothetical protein ABIO04_03725 [Ferruginibacter sp.]
MNSELGYNARSLQNTGHGFPRYPSYVSGFKALRNNGKKKAPVETGAVYQN